MDRTHIEALFQYLTHSQTTSYRLDVARVRLHVLAVASLLLMVMLLHARPRLDTASAGIGAWSGEDVTAALAWAIAVATCAWLPAIAVVYETGCRLRRPQVARAAVRAAPPFARRILEVALVGTSVVATAAPVTAAPGPPAVLAFDEPVVRAPATETPARTPASRTAPPTRPRAKPRPRPTTPPTTTTPVEPAPALAPAPRAATAPDRRPQTSYVVRTGDNLWTIARAALIARGTRDPDDTTIVPYWQSVIAANAGALRSGDPNLIYPGEIVALPVPA
jgi:hypothetical protein